MLHPDGQRQRRVPELVQSIDIAPTLLELAGVGDILAKMFQPTNEEGGVTFEVMEKWVPLARKLRKAKKSALLEDAEHELLLARFKVTKWLTANEDILAIGQAVHGAEIIEAVEKKEEKAAKKDE